MTFVFKQWFKGSLRNLCMTVDSSVYNHPKLEPAQGTSAGDWISKLLHIYTIDYFSATRRKELLIPAHGWLSETCCVRELGSYRRSLVIPRWAGGDPHHSSVRGGGPDSKGPAAGRLCRMRRSWVLCGRWFCDSTRVINSCKCVHTNPFLLYLKLRDKVLKLIPFLRQTIQKRIKEEVK